MSVLPCESADSDPWAGVLICAMGWPTFGVAGTNCGACSPVAAGPPAGVGDAFILAFSSATESAKRSIAADEQSSSSELESLPKLRLAAGDFPDQIERDLILTTRPLQSPERPLRT